MILYCTYEIWPRQGGIIWRYVIFNCLIVLYTAAWKVTNFSICSKVSRFRYVRHILNLFFDRWETPHALAFSSRWPGHVERIHRTLRGRSISGTYLSWNYKASVARWTNPVLISAKQRGKKPFDVPSDRFYVKSINNRIKKTAWIRNHNKRSLQFISYTHFFRF